VPDLAVAITSAATSGPHVPGSYCTTGRVLQHRIDHPPRGLDAVVLGEQRGVAAHGIAEQALIGRFFALRMMPRDQFDGLAAHLLAVALDQRARADHDLGTQPQAKIIGRHRAARHRRSRSGGSLQT
jgi:hypothetical protein